MSDRTRRQFRWLVGLAVIPTALDVGLLVFLRQGLETPLIVADAVSVAAASAVSFWLHRSTALRISPFSRWVQTPPAFVLVALVAGTIDVVVLRLAFAVAGFESVGGLLAAKALAIAVSVIARLIGYRWILAEQVRAERELQPDRPPSVGSLQLSVVIPAYREADHISATVRAVLDELADIAAGGGLEVIVVDDGSGDGTADAALDAGARQVIVLPRNRGKGAAVRAGVLASRGRSVVFTDADLAYSPDHLRTVLEHLESGWDATIGSRRHPRSTVARSSVLRALGSRVVNRISGAVLLAGPLDTQCGLKGFRGDVARDIFARTRIDGFAFDIEVLHLIDRERRSITEVPVRLDESGATSSVHIVRDVLRLSADMARIRRWSSRGDYDGPVMSPGSTQSSNSSADT